MNNFKRYTLLTDDSVSYSDSLIGRNISTDWILWQEACNKMKAEILKELRAHHKDNAVTSHEDVDALICEVHHPELPAK